MASAQTGNVGINTTAPTETLDVNGQVRVRTLNASQNNDFVMFSSATGNVLRNSNITLTQLNNAINASTGTNWSLSGNSNAVQGTSFIGTTNAVDLDIKTNNAQRMKILSSNGKVGVGTLIPRAVFEVLGPNYDPKAADEGSVGNYATLRVNGSGHSLDMGTIASGPYGAYLQAHNQSTPGGLPIVLNPNGGNIGLNTLNPSEQLDINGKVRVRTLNAAAASDFLVFASSPEGVLNKSSLTFSQINTTIQNAINSWSLSGNSNAVQGTSFIGTTNAVDLDIKTNNAQRMKILSSNGKVGVNTVLPRAIFEVLGPNYDPKVTDEGTAGDYATFRINGSGHSLDMGTIASSPYGTYLQSHSQSAPGGLPMILNPNGGKVGVGTSPTQNQPAKFNINGDLYIATVNKSSEVTDIPLVIGSDGVVKKQSDSSASRQIAGRIAAYGDFTSDNDFAGIGDSQWIKVASGNSVQMGNTPETGTTQGWYFGNGYTVTNPNAGTFVITFSSPFSELYGITVNIWDVYTSSPNNNDTLAGFNTGQWGTQLLVNDNAQIGFISNTSIMIKTGDNNGNRKNRSFSFVVSGR